MTCYTQSYCSEGTPLAAYSLISDILSNKISYHILKCSKFFQLQVALFFIKYWNSVLEIGKIALTFYKNNSRLIGWLVLLSPGQIYSLDSIAKSRKYIPFVLREWDSLPEKQSVCFDLTSNTSPAIVIDPYNLKNSRNLFIYKIFLMILCLCYQRKGDLLNDFLVWS